ncbi:hypothetical protein ACN38_g9611 [Penicillium nordicum]|uniref:Uncharacterized protein n=1 Tax=Penicillium nordicum TaxID=229535 RepID=A0A0M8NUA3_9EURO|nr:hypothetical protein ACN38_g9611 [Penicillium nordicum]
MGNSYKSQKKGDTNMAPHRKNVVSTARENSGTSASHTQSRLLYTDQKNATRPLESTYLMEDLKRRIWSFLTRL